MNKLDLQITHKWQAFHSLEPFLMQHYTNIFSAESLLKTLKSESIFLSLVSRVTKWGLKPLELLSCRISQCSVWTQSRADKSLREERGLGSKTAWLPDKWTGHWPISWQTWSKWVSLPKETKKEKKKKWNVFLLSFSWETCCYDTSWNGFGETGQCLLNHWC